MEVVEGRVKVGQRVWGCAWRGGSWGLALGGALGAAYGAALLALALVGETIAATLGGGGSREAALYAFVVAPYGALLGGALGAMGGLPLGLLVGLLAAATARARPHAAPWASAALVVIVLLGWYAARDANPAAFILVANTSGVFDDGPRDLLTVVLIPIGLAGVAAWRLGRHLAAVARVSA